MNELRLQTGTFILIQETRTYAIKDQDLRFTLAHLTVEERREIRDYLRGAPVLESYSHSYMLDMSKARIQGFRTALFAIQVARDLQRSMKGVGKGRAGHGRRVGNLL